MIIVTYQPDGLVSSISAGFLGVEVESAPGMLVISDEAARDMHLDPMQGTTPYYVDLSDLEDPRIARKTMQTVSVSGTPQVGVPLTLTAPHDFAVSFSGQLLRSMEGSLTFIPTQSGTVTLVDGRQADLLPYAIKPFQLNILP